MTKEIYLFNPENDMALANFTPYYKAPKEIIRMANDLSVLPSWYAPEGSIIKVNSLLQADLQKRQCPVPELTPQVEWCDTWENAPYRPWGWNPSLLHTLRQSGVNENFLLSNEQIQRLRFLSGRQRCTEILQSFTDSNLLCGEAMVCDTLSQIQNYVRNTGECILKAPWSGSGRGLVHVSPTSWTSSIEGWAERILRVQGNIMAEPLYNKVKDFAMEFYSDEKGHTHFIGYSLFETDIHGNYKANILSSDKQIEQILSYYIPTATLHNTRQTLETVLSDLIGTAYHGYLGVDMMICRASGNYNYQLHPCVEVNLRMNMGVVSHLIFERYVHPQAHGKYIVEYYATDGEALEVHQQYLYTHPLKLQDEKLAKGYFSLTPVEKSTRYHIFLLLT